MRTSLPDAIPMCDCIGIGLTSVAYFFSEAKSLILCTPTNKHNRDEYTASNLNSNYYQTARPLNKIEKFSAGSANANLKYVSCFPLFLNT